MIEGFHLLFHESGLAPLFHPLSASFSQKKNTFSGCSRCPPLSLSCQNMPPRPVGLASRNFFLAVTLQKNSFFEGFHLLFHESGVAPLFHPLSASFGHKTHIFGVFQVCVTVCLWSKTCPRDHFPCRRKKIYLSTHSLGGHVNFVTSFVLALSLKIAEVMRITSAIFKSAWFYVNTIINSSDVVFLYVFVFVFVFVL